MEKQVTQNKSQAGFSLIELLVVVAIIGVLAAAGIVGYTSYLNGVKDDTHKNNAKTIAKALMSVGVARVGNLTVQPTACADAGATARTCAATISADGKFKSPLDKTAVDGAYIASGATACSLTTKGLLVVQEATSAADGLVFACSKDAASAIESATFGRNW